MRQEQLSSDGLTPPDAPLDLDLASSQLCGLKGIEKPGLVSTIHFNEVETFPSYASIKHGQLFSLSLKTTTVDLTHGLHRFPAKFVPQIPSWAIREFTMPGDSVLDPFMGSGTTLVEALRYGVTAVGVDIDPLARLIAHAKTDRPSSQRIELLGTQLISYLSEYTDELSAPMPDIHNFDHWFSRDSWAKLQNLNTGINKIQCSVSERNFLIIVFSSILRWVSNADDQSHKTYVSGTRPKAQLEVGLTFQRALQKAVYGLKQLEVASVKGGLVDIPEDADACNLGLRDKSIDLIVTSPPYLDSVDYMYNFMLEYFWLGSRLGVNDRKSYNSHRRLQLGAKHPINAPDVLPIELQDLIPNGLLPKARVRPVAAYFSMMAQHFGQAANCLKTGSYYILVIGNSQTSTGIVPVHDCLIRLAGKYHLRLEKAFAYRVRRHYMKFPRNGRGGIILIDWIIVLRKVEEDVVTPERLPLPWATLGHRDVAN